MSDQDFQWKPGIPRWVQIYELIRGRIESGELAPGDQVPSVLQLQATYGIATATGQKVHRALRADRLVRTEPGMGSFVLSEAERATSPDQD
ncbi:GntR family transcriptional regulator [Streptosporangium jomthongense]|uniref:GntR family transcriptional regulator n=1 Tax=Streptosporangium jomthongense TaxID=1193683 RepID=A0ABV8F0V1_9ACTN